MIQRKMMYDFTVVEGFYETLRIYMVAHRSGYNFEMRFLFTLLCISIHYMFIYRK